jgi:GH25 family lysozyme M1 (1,4-beta-N-acetylmuramidase)
MQAKRAGCHWALVRAATTGTWNARTGRPTLIKDYMYDENSAACARAGIKRVAYAWFDPRVNLVSAVDQAENFLVSIRDYPPDLGVCLDVEDVGQIHASFSTGPHIRAWLEYVGASLQVRPLLYTNLDFTSRYLFNDQVREPWLTDYLPIVASWGTNAPYVPQPWAPFCWAAWQYRANAPGDYYGFGKRSVCLAVWNGDL